MVLEPIYLDLSSSDDDDDEHNRPGSTALMYLSKVFHVDADDDDVRIIDKPTSNAGVRRNRARVIRSALDDDECCILDTDPGADAVPDIVSSPDADELVMTGEKGPVACRDFPHARYLCVHFPFQTTLHSKFCAQCHCYVCDSLAPCPLWGEGSNPNDHCHASEEPRWKTLRKIAKCGSVPSLATGAADPTGGSRLVQSSILQHTTKMPTQSPVGTPVGSGVSRLSQPKVKRDPLVIKLQGKGRGKPSQPPHLGVRSPRPHRVLPLSSYPGRKNRPPPRPTSTPSGRLEEVKSPVSTSAQPPQPTDPNPGVGRPECRGTLSALPPHLRSISSLNPLPGSGGASTTDILAKKTRPPGGQLPQPTLHPSAAPYSPTVSPPVPNILPSPTSLPPPIANDVLLPPSAGATVPDVVSPARPVPDSRYVPASTLRDQDVNMGLSSFSQPQAVHKPSMIVGANDVAQRFSSPVNSASSTHPVDILAGPIEGWEVDAAVDLDAFAAGIGDVDASPQRVVASLNDVVQQMADEIKRISDVWIRVVQETGK